MPFVTIREILGKVERFHGDFGRRLHAAEIEATNQDAKMMLKFLGNHQAALSELLGTMEKGSAENLGSLGEWVQFDTEVEDPRKFLEDFRVDPAASGAQVLEAANKLDICLFCLYKGLAKGSATPKAQRLFARLARLELEHQKAKGGGYY